MLWIPSGMDGIFFEWKGDRSRLVCCEEKEFDFIEIIFDLVSKVDVGI